VASESEEVRVAVVHGPNLNLLGTREPAIYGHTPLTSIDAALLEEAARLGVALETYQANGEGRLIDFIHAAAARVDGFLVNAAAYTHTSLALADALAGINRPFVEVHLSNPAARGAIRRRSLLAPHAAGIVSGFGPASYVLALQGLVQRLQALGADRRSIAGQAI
jgi:3-dehydroquinate dehydratase II